MIEVKEIKKYFYKKGAFTKEKTTVKAVDEVSFFVPKGGTFGLVGESGCGKTTVAKLLAGIIQADEGSINISGEIDMVFQDPFSSLNPRMKIVDIIGEALYVRGVKKEQIRRRVSETLDLVKLGGKTILNRYPHQFSGGQRQRIAIARALVHRPEVIILDEPVSSLDVSIQASILNLLKDLQDELNLTYVFISHDLRIVEFMAEKIAVMKDGKFVEISSKKEIYSSPKHEYTRYLLDSIPKFS